MFNFVFALNKARESGKVVDMDERIVLARNCGSTKPVVSVLEAIDSLITKLEELKKEQYYGR